MKYLVALLMLTLLCICYAEDSPIATQPWTTPAIAGRTKRFSCRDIMLVCPTQEKYFVVPVSWSWRSLGCKMEKSILDTALEECDNSIMDLCKDKWVDKQNHCSIPIPILKQILNHVFHGACSLHDLCYAVMNVSRRDCDDWFLYNMKQICSTKKLSRPLCLIAAYKMYGAVRLFGKGPFKRGQKWAKEHCIPESTEGPKLEGSGNELGSGLGSGSKMVGLASGSGTGSAEQPIKQIPPAKPIVPKKPTTSFEPAN